MLGLATLVATLLRFRARACVALACLAAMLFTASTVSANPPAETKTRVWDFSSAAPLNVWLERSASPRTHLENQSGSLELTSVSPHAARAGAAAVRFHKHHTVPREILKQLPADVAKHPLVRGRAGAPNRWSIPEDVHKAIHKGPGGGAYNEAFKQRLNDLGRRPTVDDVVGIRDDLVRQFGLEGYRP